MVKFRRLVNPLILNKEDWVGFMGDSEYLTQSGELRMGLWTWLGQIEDSPETIYCLDDEIDDDEVFRDNTFWIRNDNGEICIIKLFYDEENAK